MKFKMLLSPFPDMQAYGCKKGPFTFVIAHDKRHNLWHCSIKEDYKEGYVLNPSLTSYKSFKECEEVLKIWYKRRNN